MAAIHDPHLFKTGIGGVLMGLVMTGICVGAWFVYQDRYWTAQAGPTEITLEQLARLENPSQLPSRWVKVTFGNIVDTGVEMLEVSHGTESVDYKFLLAQAGDRWIVATVPEDFRGKTLAGEIYHSSNPQDVEAFVEIHRQLKEVHGGRMFPFEFRADIDFGENWTMFAYLVGGFALVGLFIAGFGGNLIRQAFQNPSRYGGHTYPPLSNPWEEDTEAELEESRT